MTDKKQPVKLVGDNPSSPGVDPGLIGSVEVELEAVLGSTKMTVAELMKLEPGSSVTLDASLDRDVELRLNGAAVARGELVALGDRYGVRVIEIIK